MWMRLLSTFCHPFQFSDCFVVFSPTCSILYEIVLLLWLVLHRFNIPFFFATLLLYSFFSLLRILCFYLLILFLNWYHQQERQQKYINYGQLFSLSLNKLHFSLKLGIYECKWNEIQFSIDLKWNPYRRRSFSIDQFAVFFRNIRSGANHFKGRTK